MAENEEKTAEQSSPAATAQEKVQDVGKKLSGFLGNLAEKAKQIDVKDLTERAKQKVDEVKSKAGEIAAGKAENFAQPREEIDGAQMKELMTKMAERLQENLPPVAAAELVDIAGGEQISCKTAFGTAADPVYAALGGKTMYVLTKASDQFTAAAYPLKTVNAVSILPPRRDVAGRMSVFFAAGEVRLPLSGLESYCKALLLYKKIRAAE